MNRIILADNQAIFRAGAARVLAMEDDMRIVAQCGDAERLMQAVSTLRSSIIIVASTLPPDFERLFSEATAAASRIVLLAENGENTSPMVLQRVEGLLNRSATGIEMVECVRKVSRGYRSVAQFPTPSANVADSVGTRVRERLTRANCRSLDSLCKGARTRNRPANRHQRASCEELPALDLRQDRSLRSPGACPLHHPSSGSG